METKEGSFLNKEVKKIVLHIDTTFQITKIALLDEKLKVVANDQWQSKQDETELLLKKIDELLKNRKIKKAYIQSIIVEPGPGHYTALRVGDATANALALALNIPVYKSPKIGSNDDKQFGFPVVPKYNKLPHITKKKP